MKSMNTLLMLALFGFAACSEPGVKKSGSSTSPVTPGPGMTTGSTGGGTTAGTTGGGTTGGTAVDPSAGYKNTIPSDNNWGSFYPNGVPAESCTAPTGQGYEPRRGTVTMSGIGWYSPDNAWSSTGEAEYSTIKYTHNNSSYLVDVNKAKMFIESDGVLKIRFKPRPQTLPPAGKSWCLNRTPMSPDPAGYTALRFSVALRGVNANGTLMPELIGVKQLTVPVNSCSAAVDFSGMNQSYPHGVVLIIRDVYKDSGCWYKSTCTNNWTAVKGKDCWQMDIEVAVDGTQTF